eukprot:GHVU01226525.1.p2 GENE.GHVU01226525.1~~GHVU01226525.1.p2  ORF type:complete len:118 (-),score=6.31 GHVU01226525.1:202-555(-)
MFAIFFWKPNNVCNFFSEAKQCLQTLQTLVKVWQIVKCLNLSLFGLVSITAPKSHQNKIIRKEKTFHYTTILVFCSSSSSSFPSSSAFFPSVELITSRTTRGPQYLRLSFKNMMISK